MVSRADAGGTVSHAGKAVSDTPDDAGGIIFKVDVSSGIRGSVVWRADAAVSKDESSRSRGMAMWGNAVYHNLTDGRVVAVDRDSGEFIFDVQIARVDFLGAGQLASELGDAAVGDAKICLLQALWRHEGSAPDNRLSQVAPRQAR